MKKIYYIFLFLLLLPICLSANPVTADDVEQAVKTQLAYKNKSVEYSIAEISVVEDENNQAKLCFIVDLRPKGFIALSSDTDITPIIAYSFRIDLVKDEENLLYYMIKKDMEFRLEAKSQFSSEKIKANNTLWKSYISGNIEELKTRNFQQWPEPGSTLTTGWIETTWSQGYPYNMFCPLDPNTGSRCVVGCVATAMSMLINYHEYVGDVSFNYSDDHYWSNGIHIDSDSTLYDFPSFNALNIYLDTLKVHYQNSLPLTNEDKAALCFACGISVHMWYSSSGSGAWTEQVTYELLNKFNYNSALWMDSWHPFFYDSLSTNMINAKPAEISIYTTGGGNGHAINCDGYNTDDFYHLNFGWGPSSPGNIITAWYSLPLGMPAGYCIIGGAVLNVEGGIRPLTVSGTVSTNGVNPIGTNITFEGDYSYSITVEDSNGFYEIPTVFPGYYTASALLGRLYYQTKEVYIDSTHNVIDFDLFNYESVTGIVSVEGGMDPTGAIINFIGDYNYSTTVLNYNGEYEILDVMPGHYTATASLNRIYYQTKEVDIDSTNMIVDFELEDYCYQSIVSYCSDPSIILDLGYEYTLKIATRFTPDELGENIGDIIGKVSFYSPAASDFCLITIKIYEGGSPEDPPGELVYEAPMGVFPADTWVDHYLETPIEILPLTEYWVGYEIYTLNGKVGWMDEGPMEPDKGAWICPSGWVCLSMNPDYDRNWLIEMTLFSTTIHDIDDTPQSFSNELVLMNYPNPFSISTTISFSATDLHRSAQIKIYNIKGQLVKHFEIHPNYIGTKSEFNEVVWDGKNENGRRLSNGIYFYQLSSKNIESKIKRMILLR
ncbi:MAG: C10 family peptidase [Candidatus Cloacimonetes bacterium]|nr:C10 family peptidase [Candidatus Cloacimonadota bacterium]